MIAKGVLSSTLGYESICSAILKFSWYFCREHISFLSFLQLWEYTPLPFKRILSERPRVYPSNYIDARSFGCAFSLVTLQDQFTSGRRLVKVLTGEFILFIYNWNVVYF